MADTGLLMTRDQALWFIAGGLLHPALEQVIGPRAANYAAPAILLGCIALVGFVL